jgi:AcrR family transcriptional regulator
MKTKNSQHATTPSRRHEIIQAALECFTELGFAQTSMAEIRRRSNASTGSIYHHFKSKEQLASDVYLEGIRNYQEGFLAVMEHEWNAQNGIFAVIRYHLQWVSQNPDWTRYLFQKSHAALMASAAGVFAGLNAEFMQRCARWLAVHVKAGTIRRLSPDMYVAILLGPVMEYTRLYLAGQTCTSAENAIQELASAAWNCLEADKVRK